MITPFENTFFTDGQRTVLKNQRKQAIKNYRNLQTTKITDVIDYQKKRNHLKREIICLTQNIWNFNLNLN